jgi:hypothetical protein
MSIFKFAAIAVIMTSALTGAAQAQGRDSEDPQPFGRRGYNAPQYQQQYYPQQQYVNPRIARKEAELAERRARKSAELRERSIRKFGVDPYARQGYSYQQRGYGYNQGGYGYQQPRYYQQPRGQYYYID